MIKPNQALLEEMRLIRSPKTATFPTPKRILSRRETNVSPSWNWILTILVPFYQDTETCQLSTPIYDSKLSDSQRNALRSQTSASENKHTFTRSTRQAGSHLIWERRRLVYTLECFYRTFFVTRRMSQKMYSALRGEVCKTLTFIYHLPSTKTQPMSGHIIGSTDLIDLSE